MNQTRLDCAGYEGVRRLEKRPIMKVILISSRAEMKGTSHLTGQKVEAILNERNTLFLSVVSGVGVCGIACQIGR